MFQCKVVPRQKFGVVCQLSIGYATNISKKRKHDFSKEGKIKVICWKKSLPTTTFQRVSEQNAKVE
jgi:hypothetical protein